MANDILDWEPNQSKHSFYCGIQGSHSSGAGKKGDCTCGRDKLVYTLHIIAFGGYGDASIKAKEALRNA